MASKLRFKVVDDASSRKPVTVEVPKERPSEYFGKYVFDRKKMFKYLPSKAYEKMCDVIDNGAPFDLTIADAVAEGIKTWAMELGVTHYTHWFQPLTEGTAEKHDGFVEHDGKGGMVEEFSGKLLVQQEPDASSFPSGGIRSTFEARGTNLGWEQEYFLVDEALYATRPDLVMTGRTLLGHDSAKNQQMDDHYFGSIPDRVENFMRDLEIQSLQLGIPCKTRHNEVAPNQFELAPIFEECNLAIDHNMLIMILMRRIARKHGFRCLLHEKPFNGVNGSGKHNNWSLSTDTGILLHGPGKNAIDNLRFVTFVAETLKAVHKHNGLLKASIMSATNAHRLGANEAPPAIISSFLGKTVSSILDHIENSTNDEDISIAGKVAMRLDIPSIPELLIDNTDRNRTSPFAFTGNRFEFRAVGAEANCASAMIALNTAMAEALTEFKKRVDLLIEMGEAKESAILKIVREDLKESKAIRFDGNGYSDEWKEEAKRRGLDCETSCPLIFDRYLDESSVRMFESQKVMTRFELVARNEIKWETYIKRIQIEARVFGDLCLNHIIPVSTRYQSTLIDNVHKVKEIFSEEKANKITANNIDIIEKISEHQSFIIENVDKMVEARKVANRIEDCRERAIAYHDTVEPFLDSIRYHVDKLELMIDDEMWPLPKYRELLFIR